MRIIFFILITFCCLLNFSCEKMPTPDGQKSQSVTNGSLSYYSVSAVDFKAAGMRYKVFNSANGNLFVVNLTKDSLETIKLLQK